MKITGDWIEHPGTQALCAALEAEGFRALFVGGCVRNALYGLPVSDIDIATDATPEKVSKVALNTGFRVIPTGIDHGTVTVLAGGVAHEVTTFRQDVETDGRRAVVAFSDDLADDAARRDFTMNALYADRRGDVIDPLGGLSDLLARHVRFVGDSAARITEDYLRVLRFFRFTAQYGDPDAGIDAEGLAACAANSAGIETLSRERIGAEMRKLLAAADPAPAVSAMAKAGVLAQVLPGADPRPLAPLVHLEGDTAPDWLRRLAALGGKDAAERLRLSRAEARDLAALHEAIGNMESPAVLGWRLGEQRGRDALLLRASVFEQPIGPLDMSEVARGAETAFPIKAADLAPLNGPALGAKLKDLQSRWLSSDLMLTKDQLLG
jgi:poly(A) polymerase